LDEGDEVGVGREALDVGVGDAHGVVIRNGTGCGGGEIRRARRHAVAAARFFRFGVCGDTGGENGVG
jgi:hypothetical protein